MVQADFESTIEGLLNFHCLQETRHITFLVGSQGEEMIQKLFFP